jgi:hypothetical protein
MNDVLAEAGSLLEKPWPTDWPNAWVQIEALEHVRYRVDMAYVEAVQALSTRKMQVLHPKDSTVTDLDRTTILEAGSAEQKANVDRLALTMDLLSERIELLREYVAMLHTETKEV